TLLPDGRVLVTGGSDATNVSLDGESDATSPPLNITWVYDPNQSETNRWSPAAPLPVTGRVLHTATLLPGGRVLVTGGYRSLSLVNSSSILYDANTGVWSPVGSMGEPRREFTAIPLPDGKVLVAGGTGPPAAGGTPLRSAEVYAASNGGSWSAAPTASLCEARHGHTATLLPDGKVLVAGGFSDDGRPLDSAELYDPAPSPPNCTSIENQLDDARGAHTATLLPTGRVLVAGGIGVRDGKLGALQSSEEYDIATQKWEPSSVHDIRALSSDHTATLLPDGQVLLAGGRSDNVVDLKSALYDPFTRAWTAAPSTGKPKLRHYSHTATLLPDGRVFVVGGYDELKRPSSGSELYAPTSQTWTLSASMSQARAQHAAIPLPTGQVLVTGGYGQDGAPLATAELYEPGTDSWSPAPPLLEARAEHALVALPDGNLLVLGGTGTSGVLSSAELYSVPGGNLAQRPLITRLEPTNDSARNSFEPGVPLIVTGERFRGGAEASGGGTGSSAVDFPLLSLRSFETGQWFTPPKQSFSDISVTATLPPRLPDGHYLLNVTSSGQTTGGKVILVRNLAPPDTFFTSPSELPPDGPAASVSFQFSSDDGDVRSYECSLDGATFTPCTSPQTVENLGDGSHTFQVRARDLADHVDPDPAQHTWRMVKSGYYGFSCSVGDGSLWRGWPWALLLLGLRRRRRPHGGPLSEEA
ncbi:Kelch repeat-containing protein, partial [Hyalangium sp.]|uniref:Kelch repeat-containing protein n=1 Tax=Hyalangium sp. TaxID=2028555 RepID=UPI002D353ED7